MADRGFQISGLMSMAVDGVFNINRMASALNQAANAGDNVARAFQAQAYAAGFANIATGKFLSSMGHVTGAAGGFEEAMSRAASLLGPTSAALDRLRTTAMTMRDVEHGPTELAKAMLELNRAGIEGTQALNDVAVVANVATVAEVGMAEAAVSVATAFKAWAGPLDTSNKLLDKFVAAANASTFSLKSLMKAMEYAQRSAIPAGVSLDTTLTALTLLAPITGPNSKAGTAFGSFVERMGDPNVVKKLKEKFPGISPYNKGVRKDPLMYMADIFEFQKNMGDPKKDEFKKVISGRISQAMFAAMQRVFTQGMEVTDPVTGAKRWEVGKKAIEAARASSTKGPFTLEDQARMIRENPKAAWAMFKAQIERAMIDFGNKLVMIFKEIQPVIMTFVKAFQFLSNAMGGALPIIGMMAMTFGVLRAAVMGVVAMTKILPTFLASGLAGPMNPSSLISSVGASRFRDFMEARNSARAGFLSGRSSPGLMQGLLGRTHDRFYNVLAQSPRYRNGIDYDDLASRAAYYTNRSPAGRVQNFFDRWYGAGNVLDRARGGMALGSRLGGAMVPLAGNVAGGVAGAVLGGAAALGTTVAASLGPLALLGAAAWGLSSVFEKLQMQEEKQLQNKAKASGIIEDLPTIHRMAMKRVGGTELSEGEIAMLNQNPTMVPILMRLIEAGASVQKGGGSALAGVSGAYAGLLGSVGKYLGGDKSSFFQMFANMENPNEFADMVFGKKGPGELMGLMRNTYQRFLAAGLTGQIPLTGGDTSFLVPFSQRASLPKEGEGFLLGPKSKDVSPFMENLGVIGGPLQILKDAATFFDPDNANNPLMKGLHPVMKDVFMGNLLAQTGKFSPGLQALTQASMERDPDQVRMLWEATGKLVQASENLNISAAMQGVAATTLAGSSVGRQPN